MAEQYNDKYVLRKIVDYKFTLHDLNPKRYPILQEGLGFLCEYHPHSDTGKLHARLYYNEEKNLWFTYCYVEGRAFYAHDHLERILIAEKGLYSSIKEFLLTKLSKDEFENLYTIFKKKRDNDIITQYERKCQWIDNVYAEKGNIVDYIETLYTS